MQYSRASIDERRTMPPSVAVSTVAFALAPPANALKFGASVHGDATIWIPFVRRTRAPFQGSWALPGGPTQWNETLTDTALRTLRSATGSDPGYLEQLYSFGGVERSAQAQRLVTIAYWALYGESDVRGASPAEAADPEGEENVAWFSADALPELAFDHAEIVAVALARLRAKTSYSTVAVRFLGPTFTLGKLRTVTEAVLGQSIDPANFRRQALAQGTLVETGEVETGARHRPSKLYRFIEQAEPQHPPTTSTSSTRRGPQ